MTDPWHQLNGKGPEEWTKAVYGCLNRSTIKPVCPGVTAEQNDTPKRGQLAGGTGEDPTAPANHGSGGANKNGREKSIAACHLHYLKIMRG